MFCIATAVPPLAPAEHPLEPCPDTLEFLWSGDEDAAQRAFDRFVAHRESNATVQSLRGFHSGGERSAS